MTGDDAQKPRRGSPPARPVRFISDEAARPACPTLTREKLSDHLSWRRVLTAGAPIPADLHRRFREILAEGVEVHTP